MSSRRTRFLYLCLLVIFILTQIVFLRWGVEALFFVTWFFLALTVRHDSRISASVGLAFLATCPILLIAKQDAVAEQAANYAYFFLAIGVVAQLEEMLLERYGGLNRKLDFSFLWQPAQAAFHRRWAAAAQALGRQLAAADRMQLVRWVQILGAGGLAVAFSAAIFLQGQLAVILLLLGGAVLFPFVVWVGRAALRAWGTTWLLRVALAVVGLLLAAAEMVWLHEAVSTERLTRLKPVYDFIDRSAEGRLVQPTQAGEEIGVRLWTIDTTTRRVLYQHPAFAGASRLAYSLTIGRGSVLEFSVAMAPEASRLDGDGVTFAVYVAANGTTRQLFSTYIDPKHNEADRRWHPYMIDLGAYAGQAVTLIFETGAGPAGDYRYDWAGWGEPQLRAP